jgi:hypothetical protein
MPKQVNRRYRLDAKAASGSKWVRLGRSYYAQSRIAATFIPLDESGIDETAPIVEMLVSVDEGSPRVEEVQVKAPKGTGLSPESVRVPLRTMMRHAVAAQSYRLEGDAAVLVTLPGPITLGTHSSAPEQANTDEWNAMERDLKRAPRNEVTEKDLRKTAEIVRSVPYRERRQAVMHQLNVSRSVAKARIAAARKRFPEEFEDAS